MEKKIVIACDHAGNEMKDAIIQHLTEKGYTVTDFGCDGTASVNYPDYAHLVCEAIAKKEAPLGILVCGTGIGMSIAANKHKGIRAACCSEAFSAELTRRHNDANVLCFGARVIDLPKALELTKIFVSTEYEGAMGGRHKQRLDKIAAIEAGLAE